MPRLSRLNPINGFSRFFSMRGFVELLKNLVKVTAVGLLVYWTVKADFEQFLPLIDKEAGQIALFIGAITYKVALRASLLILLIGILDYIWVRYKYFKDLRMTKQEVKEEARQMEGPPEIRSKIRSIQLRTSMQRMMRAVPSAEVVITNPVHLAVALKYQPESMPAPVVVAKGARLIADKIKQIALENNIPIVENKPLAQALYKSVDLGQMISPEFYAAVAEILAYVFRLKESRQPQAA
jgi:flagellar biosynthetic protein FlhB